MTTGWLIGELVKRVSGKSLGKFFNNEISEPYNLDYWIGLPEKDERVAKVTPFKPSPSINQVTLQQFLEQIQILTKTVFNKHRWI